VIESHLRIHVGLYVEVSKPEIIDRCINRNDKGRRLSEAFEYVHQHEISMNQ